MKRILTLVCLCLSFSIMSANGISTIDSKDVIKQKTEFVKTQDLFQVDKVIIISQEAEKNFQTISKAVSSEAVMDVQLQSHTFNTIKAFLSQNYLKPDINLNMVEIRNCKFIQENTLLLEPYKADYKQEKLLRSFS